MSQFRPALTEPDARGAIPPPRGRASLERRLPLLFAGLLTIAVAALLLAIHGELERSEVAAEHARLASGVVQVGELVDQAAVSTRAALINMATAPAVRSFAARRGGSATDTAQVRGILTPFGNQAGRYVELATPTGERLLSLGSRPDTLAIRSTELVGRLTARDSVVNGVPVLVGTHAYSPIAAPVVVGGVVRGAIVRWVRVGALPATESALQRLVDPRAEMYFSHPASGLVIDPSGELVSPTPDLPNGDSSGTFVVTLQGEEYLGARAVMASSPWQIVTLMPRNAVVAATTTVFNRLAIAAFAIVAIGTLIGWLASRRITRPLLRVTEAAESLAAGRYEQRVALTRADEIGRLAATFDDMARRISDAYERLNSARAEAESANAAKSRFLGTMSHEIRTPLNAIVGYTEFLLVGIGGPISPQQRTYVERVQTSARHLLGLVSDLLDLSSIEAGRLRVQCQPAPLRDPVHDAVAVLESQALEREMAICVECDDSLWYRGDPARLRQIIINLLSNAIKFSRPGSEVIMICDSTVRADPALADHEERTWTRVTVRDKGIGIAPDKVAMIWDAFVQGDDSRTRMHGGSGLGLTISRRLARLMGGDITVQSEPGNGSAFTIWLPAAEPDAAANSVTAA